MDRFWDVLGICCVVLMPLALHAQNEPSRPSGCAQGGAVFGRELIGHTLMLKDRTGYLTSVELPPQIAIWKVHMSGAGEASSTPIRATFDDIHTNDLVCIEGDREAKKYSKLTIIPRVNLERAQREFALNWQASSVFGYIATIDPATRKINVVPFVPQTPPAPTEITFATNILFRTYPPTALRINDASQIRFEDLQVGDRVYIRGHRVAGTAMLEATLVVKGGMRALIGTLLEAGAAKVRIREYGTGKTLDISIPSTLVYRTAAELTNSSGAVKLDESGLATISAADIQAGDTVLVVGSTDYSSNSGTGLGVIAQFGYFGTSPTDGAERITWILK
jgi:hypothetical protein